MRVKNTFKNNLDFFVFFVGKRNQINFNATFFHIKMMMVKMFLGLLKDFFWVKRYFDMTTQNAQDYIV